MGTWAPTIVCAAILALFASTSASADFTYSISKTFGHTQGYESLVTGYITTDGYFDPTQLRGYSGSENIELSADQGMITFGSTPGSYVDGVDLVSSTDPIYLDLRVDNARTGFGTYFTGAESGTVLSSDYNPVAFTSP